MKLQAFRKKKNKDTPAEVFSYEYCEIFKNTYFKQHLRMAASDTNEKCSALDH